MMKKLLIFVCLFNCITGCSSHQLLSVTVWNKTGLKLNKVKVWDEESLVSSVGVLVRLGQKTSTGYREHLSENIKLTWMEYESGIKREIKVDMNGVIPDKYHNGTVQFDILGADEVTVKFYFEPVVHYPPKPKE